MNKQGRIIIIITFLGRAYCSQPLLLLCDDRSRAFQKAGFSGRGNRLDSAYESFAAGVLRPGLPTAAWISRAAATLVKPAGLR